MLAYGLTTQDHNQHYGVFCFLRRTSGWLLLCCTCHKVSKANGAEGDEAVVDGLRVGPALMHLEHDHGHNEEENYSSQVRHQMDEEAGTPLQWDEKSPLDLVNMN